MDGYEIWVDLAPGVNDLEFSRALAALLDHLQADGRIEGWRLRRRKLGFGPAELGEFWISIETRDLAQLDTAFSSVAVRAGELEDLHREVFSRIRNYRSALYRDFPDAVRSV